MILWPDLGMYGMRLVRVVTQNDKVKLVLLGGEKQPSRAAGAGFEQINGIWVHKNDMITLKDLKAHFPHVVVREVSAHEITMRVRDGSRLNTYSRIPSLGRIDA